MLDNARKNEVTSQAARLVGAGATMLASAVLSDSGMEHYRGSFKNRTMFVPLAVSTISIGVNAHASGHSPPPDSRAREVTHLATAMTGLIGLGFHAYNILKRPGGVRWVNIFYGAPAGAPAALILAGTLGWASNRLASGETDFLNGRTLAGIIAGGLLGTVGEAGLLHFRGAFHNPFMYAPVTLPPVSAAALARDAVTGEAHPSTRFLLGATAALGLIGVAFHSYGVHRNMGGWRNWRQNLLAGPPLPAPPSFTGLAIAGFGALLLLGRKGKGNG